MNGSRGLLTICFVGFAGVAGAYEYPLHFTPNSGARGLVVAGYQFSGNTVVGNCSYYTVQSGSGRGGGYHTTTTYYNQTCTWDFYGNLLSITPGAPAVPPVQYTNGTQTVYGINGADTTGYDSKFPGGFVSTPGSHYTWLTSNAYTVLQTTPYTFTATLVSDGDLPLTIAGVQASALKAKVTVNSTTCGGQSLAVGGTCSVTLTYNATKTCSGTGLAYDTLDLSVISDAGQAHDFIQSYTVVVKLCDD